MANTAAKIDPGSSGTEPLSARPAWLRYGVAVGCVILGWALRTMLIPLWGPTLVPFIFFYPLVTLAAWYGGFRPGLLAMFLATATACWFFMEPLHSFALRSSSDWIALLVFATAGLVIISAIEAMHRAKARAHVEIAERKETQAALAESEQRLKHALEATTEGVWEWNIKTGRVRFSRAWIESLGYSPEEVPGHVSFWEGIVHPDDMPGLRRALDDHFAGRTPLYMFENRLRKKSGEYRWNLDRGKIVERDAEGKPLRMIGTDTDITERKQAEEALRASEERLRLALEAGRMGAWEWNISSGQVTWSPTLEEIHGLKPGTFGGTLEDFKRDIHPEEVERVLGRIQTALETRSGYHTTYRMLHPDGSVRWLEAYGRVFVGPTGAPAKMAGVCTDITDRKKADEALREARDELARANEVLEQRVGERTARLHETVAELEALSYSIAHDMRSPLRSMQGFARIIREEYAHGLDGTAQQLLERIADSAARLDRMILEILNYGKLARGTLELRPVNIEKLIGEILVSYPVLQQSQAKIEVEGPLPPVLANEAALTQVFSNLLVNAVKFVPEGTVPAVRIRVSPVDQVVDGAARQDSLNAGHALGLSRARWVRVWVEDNGIGISSESQGRLFQMFQTLNPPGRFDGTGMGLAIVRKAIERMGGAVGVESVPNMGSRFWVQLQRADGPPELQA